jgi:hypothetical protein
MRIVGPNDWRIESLPERHTTIDLHIAYSKAELQEIKKGLIPQFMEEKWFVYFDQGILNFHRSWTGFCIYKVYCREEGDRFILSHADVNRDDQQYKETNDDVDRQMIKFLVEVLLLKKSAAFPSSSEKEENILKVWSSIGSAVFTAKSDESLSDFVRIIPFQRFVGYPAYPIRPYAFYADAASLKGKTVADCYSLVKGLRLPPMEPAEKYCNPFLGSTYNEGDYDLPIANIKVKRKKTFTYEELPQKELDKNKYVVLRVPRHIAVGKLDVFPGTWRALSFIVSDPERMSARKSDWNMKLTDYLLSHFHEHFKEIQKNARDDLLAVNQTKESLGLTELDQLPEQGEEFRYYSYLSKDSAFTNRIMELFGISCRCWHGCGYIGSIGQPLCRIYLLKNELVPEIKISVMKGRDSFV